MRPFWSFSMLCLLATGIFAGGEETLPEKTDDVLLNRLQLTQLLDEQIKDDLQESPDISGSGKKSVGMSVMLSALIPGAGQAYSGAYWKSAIFLAAEVTGWAVNRSYNKKGKDKDTEFKAFAHENWSEYRYWSYVNYLAGDVAEVENFTQYPYDVVTSNDGREFYLIDEQFYNANQAQIEADMRAVENRLPQSYGFTHDLPETETQQYFEMIGKYPEQFGNAWSDADFRSRYSGYRDGVITPFNESYTIMRDESNQFYNKAGYGTMTIMINHLIAAIDAGFTARRFNNNLQVEMSYRQDLQRDQFVNLFGLNVSF
ncbi:MAG: DUF5683 domain-containing protein [Calditrichia bacterium]